MFWLRHDWLHDAACGVNECVYVHGSDRCWHSCLYVAGVGKLSSACLYIILHRSCLCRCIRDHHHKGCHLVWRSKYLIRVDRRLPLMMHPLSKHGKRQHWLNSYLLLEMASHANVLCWSSHEEIELLSSLINAHDDYDICPWTVWYLNLARSQSASCSISGCECVGHILTVQNRRPDQLMVSKAKFVSGLTMCICFLQDKELEHCTFSPRTRSMPSYIKRMASCHAAKRANSSLDVQSQRFYSTGLCLPATSPVKPIDQLTAWQDHCGLLHLHAQSHSQDLMTTPRSASDHNEYSDSPDSDHMGIQVTWQWLLESLSHS